MDNMTAMVSCFARAYHYKNNSQWVFKDDMAEHILTKEEYDAISCNMSNGISYFASGFTGTSDEALRFIVDNQLSPPVLARSAFNEKALSNAVMLGCKQYVLFASGYDTYSLRTENKEINLYEIDLPEMIKDKRNRIIKSGLTENCKTIYVPCDLSDEAWTKILTGSGFDKKRSVFGSLLGISYYLKKEEFVSLLKNISELWCEGSSICFDYPSYEKGVQSIKNQELAAKAGEEMKARYSYEEMEQLLSEFGFLIYEHHDSKTATEHFFRKYNESLPEHMMEAPEGVNYCLAVKKY